MDGRQEAGVIEGFYGKPWSHSARLSMVRFVSDVGLGWYVHAPKDDPKHRAKWDAPYSDRELAELSELAQVGRDAGVRITVAIAPQRLVGMRNLRATGDRDSDGINDEQLRRLWQKVDSLRGVGIRHFALMFDDTLATFLPIFATRRLGAFHARVANQLWSRLVRDDAGGSLFVTPSVYWGRFDELGRGRKAYYRGLGELDERIAVAWTGPGIYSGRISGTDAEAQSTGTGLRTIIWNNAITNDYLPLLSGTLVGLSGVEKLSFGPPENMTPDLPIRVAGILLNAAREAELTKVALSCMADFVQRPESYDPAAAHARALARVGGESGAAVLARLYDLTRRHHLTTRDRVEGARISEAIRRFRGGDPASRGAIQSELSALAALRCQAQRAIGPTPLLEEITPSLEKIEWLARAGLAGLERTAAQRTADPEAVRAHRESARRYVARARRIRWQVGLHAVERWLVRG
jgi:hyaluronoglucosaminidase